MLDPEIENTEHIFFTEIEDEYENDTRKIKEQEITVQELSDVLKSCEETDLIEVDLTVDSIQNNRSDSILIDDFVEGDR